MNEPSSIEGGDQPNMDDSDNFSSNYSFVIGKLYHTNKGANLEILNNFDRFVNQMHLFWCFFLEPDRVQVMVDFGFPQEYVYKCLQDNEANYCTSGYYLLGLDQNY